MTQGFLLVSGFGLTSAPLPTQLKAGRSTNDSLSIDSAMADDSLPSEPYDVLPEPIRAALSREEYRWLTDDQKAHVERDLLDPEW